MGSRRINLMILAIALACGCSPSEMDVDATAQQQSSNATVGDLEKLQGNWMIVQCNRDGVPNPGEVGGQISFVGDTAIVTTTDGVRTEYQVSLDPDLSPKAIDWTMLPKDEPRVLHGVYDVDGDTLTNCSPPEFGAPRPPENATRRGDGRWVFVSTRLGDGEEERDPTPLQDSTD